MIIQPQFTFIAQRTLSIWVYQILQQLKRLNYILELLIALQFSFESPLNERICYEMQLRRLSRVKKSELLKLCPTRWSERDNTVSSFVDLFPAIYTALCNIIGEDSFDASTTVQANGFARTICSESFLFTLALISHVISSFVRISNALQSINVNLNNVSASLCN
jgi:hypothetical protein